MMILSIDFCVIVAVVFLARLFKLYIILSRKRLKFLMHVKISW